MPSKEAKITLVLPEEQKELLQRRAKAKDLSLNKYLLSVIFPKEDKKEIENAILLKNVLDKQIDIIRTCYQALDGRLRSILSVSAKNVGIPADINDTSNNAITAKVIFATEPAA